MTRLNQRIVLWLFPAVICGTLSFSALAQAVGGRETASGKASAVVNAKAAGLGQGRGIALSDDGSSMLHLRLDTGVGFDTNPYSLNYASNFGSNGGKFSGDLMARLRPGVELEIPGNIFAFRLESSVDAGGYPGTFNPGLFENWFAKDGQGTRQLSLIKISNSVDMEVNRGGMFSFALGDSFNFSRDPQVLSFALGNVLSNTLRLGGGFRPGGGALTIKGGASLGLALYIPCEGVAILGCSATDTVNNPDFNSASLNANLRVDYRFLPRTGFFAELRAGAHGYFNTIINNGGSQPYTVPLHFRIGAKGQFSSRLSGLASIGYDLPLIFDSSFQLGLLSTFAAGTTMGNIGQVTAFNAQLEARWRISHAIKLSGGFQRTVSPTPVFQYRIPNKLYVSYQQAIGTFLTVTANASIALVQYGSDINAGTTAAVVDVNSQNGFLSLEPAVKFGVAYHVFDWMSIGINNNFIYHSGLGMLSKGLDGSTSEVDFIRNETLVMLSIHY